MKPDPRPSRRSLDDQHTEFVRSRFLAMPIAGAICWTAIGIAGAVLSLTGAVWAVLSVVMAVLVYAIAIPFFLVEPTSLPLSVGILAGLMWVPFSGLIEHWVGYFHAFSRTALVLVVWYAFPEARFVAVPTVIVAVYLVTILVLVRRVSRPTTHQRQGIAA